MKRNKTCFLITPLGELSSRTRTRADAIAQQVIAPLLPTHALDLIRGEAIPEQGNVMVQVVREILDAAAVFVDLTGLNANVLYELGIADAFRKPVLRMIDDPRHLPFNLRADRTIVVRTTEDGNLAQDDIVAAQPFIAAFLNEVTRWDFNVSSAVTQAIKDLPPGSGEAGWARMIGGYRLADGWSGIEKALKAAGCNTALFRAKNPTPVANQYSVVLLGALVSDIAQLHLSFGDWTEQEVEAYLRDLIRVLIECGSPYRVVARLGTRTYVAEPGEQIRPGQT
jgi:hypothetical protein